MSLPAPLMVVGLAVAAFAVVWALCWLFAPKKPPDDQDWLDDQW